MDPWPAVVAVGFALATTLVIVLARSSTGRWEHQRVLERRRRMVRSLRRRRGPRVPQLQRRRRSRRVRQARRG